MKILLDMDGVIVDLHRGICERFNIDTTLFPKPLPWNWVVDFLKMDPNIFWGQLDAAFWTDLHWTPEGKEILARLIAKYGLHNICISSSPGNPKYDNWETIAAGKRRWLQKHLPGVASMLGQEKYFFAHPESILIDDHDDNVNAFRYHGGRAVLVPRLWNSYYELNTLEFIRKEI